MKLTIYNFLFWGLVIFSTKLQAQSPTQNITLRSHLNLNQKCANIWGYVQNNKEYALVGTATGSSIVDVTNPDAPTLIKSIPAVNSDWREIRTYKNYAYVTTEGVGQGLQIVNLAGLPVADNVTVKNYKGGDSTLVSILKVHALHIDTTKGFIYLYGGQSKVKIGTDTVDINGAVVLDLKTDPWNPKFVGIYRTPYIHDGTVENDTLYAGHIFAGYVSVIDFKDKKNPQLLASQRTPNEFPHNTWLSNDHKTMFTTDERGGAYLAAYDISDLNNIKLVDKIRSVSGANAIVHNTYIKGNYAVTSWYTEGVTIVDATRPYNLVQVGQYDTYNGTRASFNGAWGVYPYLPSGNLIVSNIEDGLYVLTPQYIRACYLEGRVTDSISKEPLSGVRIKINSNDPDKLAESNLQGFYNTGQVTNGEFTVTYSKTGYYDKTVTINLIKQETAFSNIELVPKGFAQSGVVVNNLTNQKIGRAKVLLTNAENTYTFDTDISGDFYYYNIQPGTYTAYIGAWGFLHKTVQNVVIDAIKTHTFRLDRGYQDDFWADFSWEISGTAANSSQGRWDFGTPVSQPINTLAPTEDMPTDIGKGCFLTGNAAGGEESSDVDTKTILTTPVIKLTDINTPILTFSYWFVNANGSTTPNDKLKVYLSNGVKDTLLLAISESQKAWRGASIALKGVLPFTETMRVYFVVEDETPSHTIEAAIDAFRIQEPTSIKNIIAENWDIKAYPNPFNSTLNIDFQIDRTVKNAKLKTTNALGQVLELQTLKNTEGVISIGEKLNKGIYFIQIEGDNKISKVIRVVKNE